LLKFINFALAGRGIMKPSTMTSNLGMMQFGPSLSNGTRRMLLQKILKTKNLKQALLLYFITNFIQMIRKNLMLWLRAPAGKRT